MDAGFTNSDQLRRQLDTSMPAAHHAKLGSTVNDLITFANAAQALHNTSMLSKAGLVIHGAASPTVKAGAAFVALTAGTLVRKAANTDMAALVGALATAKSAAWAFYISSAGTLSVSAKTPDSTTHDIALAAVTAPPAGCAQIGIVVVDNATGAGFVGGTTALDTGSLTVTYYDTIGASFVAPAAVGAFGTR